MGAGLQRWWRSDGLERAGIEWLRQQNALIGTAIRRLPGPGSAKQLAEVRRRIEALSALVAFVTRRAA